jgi:hypothetical protein
MKENNGKGADSMPRKIGTGVQSFSKLRERGSFFVDKTEFISDWWNSDDDVTLITRPRRFGKTLMLSTVEKFFSVRQGNNEELFKGLNVYNDTEMMELYKRKLMNSLSMVR